MRQKRILIISHPFDLHGRAAAFAIREKGHVCEEMFCPDLPTNTTISLTVSHEHDLVGAEVRHLVGEFDAAEGRFDTVWLRRIESPWLPENMHPGDREIATHHCSRFLNDFVTTLDGPDVFWVNHYQRESTYVLKLYQLREAKRAGLVVPRTLVGNDPGEIRKFIESCGGVAAHKMVQLASWKSDEANRYACYTSPVTSADLPDDDTLRLCPAILQPLLEKRFEVRVACFGDCLVALKIDSQADERARTDWRRGQWYVDMVPYALPDTIARGIRSFLRSTGMVSASLDFIVTPDGEHVFLEANPQGQFLWMEDRAGLPLLDIVSDFLITGDPRFQYNCDSPKVRFAQFAEVWENGLREQTQEHVCERTVRIVPD